MTFPKASLLVLLALIVPNDAFAVSATYAYNVPVEGAVRETFADAPIMIEVARCESRFRQFDELATTTTPVVLMGGYQKKMVGIFQIFGQIHRKAALARGWDIDTIKGNIAYARYLYDTQGTSPWLDSSPCWGKSSAAYGRVEAVKPEASRIQSAVTNKDITSIASTTTIFPTKQLRLGTIDPEVKALQIALNNAGFYVAQEGPGSPGAETEKFGAFTREALRKFQCAKDIVCTGSEETTGYGLVGARTRAALMSLAYVSR